MTNNAVAEAVNDIEEGIKQGDFLPDGMQVFQSEEDPS
jgi:hypothetical protein